jgi:hypothetical protein
MVSLLLNVAGSLIAIAILYGLYVWASHRSSRDKANAQLWWLPAWKCFRLVIRNIPYEYDITDIRSRAWLRDLIPHHEGSSVNSFKDVDLICSDRIMSWRGDDYPLVCFRLAKTNVGYSFVLTDKFGAEISTHVLSKAFEELLIEYSAKIQTGKLLKYEVNRTFVFPYRDKKEGDIFSELLAMQGGPEAPFRKMLLKAEVVRISI